MPRTAAASTVNQAGEQSDPLGDEQVSWRMTCLPVIDDQMSLCPKTLVQIPNRIIRSRSEGGIDVRELDISEMYKEPISSGNEHSLLARPSQPREEEVDIPVDHQPSAQVETVGRR